MPLAGSLILWRHLAWPLKLESTCWWRAFSAGVEKGRMARGPKRTRRPRKLAQTCSLDASQKQFQATDPLISLDSTQRGDSRDDVE
jgi:hypothetical protein